MEYSGRSVFPTGVGSSFEGASFLNEIWIVLDLSSTLMPGGISVDVSLIGGTISEQTRGLVWSVLLRAKVR